MGCRTCRSVKGPCGNKSVYLRNFRVRATTLYNTTKDLDKKNEYRSLIQQIDELIQQPATSCPSEEEITLIKNYIDSEYAKRIR